MVRIEIIANNSVLDDILDGLERVGKNDYYTIIPVVHGRGNSSPKRGDHVWPEENFLLIVYSEASEVASYQQIVDTVKEKFPDEGVKLFTIGN